MRNLQNALRRKDLAEAEKILECLKIEAPASVETRGLELEYLLESDRLKEANRLSDQLAALFPGSGRILFLAGKTAYRLRDYSRAARLLEESLRIYPHWRSRHWLARALTQQGKLDDAEPMLLELAQSHPHCRADLAWLYERKNDSRRAIEEACAYLEQFPDDRRVKAQIVRLRASGMDSKEIIEEVDTLSGLGEEVPDDLKTQYLESLLKTGQGAKAREFVRAQEHHLETRLSAKLGWVCYRLQAFDLAFDLFIAAFAENAGNVKFLTSIESAAVATGQTTQLLKVYEAHAPDYKKLYGRMKSLEKKRDAGV